MAYTVLASGSTGNAILVRSNGTRVLIDCGIPVRDLGDRMAVIGERPGELAAVCLTHEHADHTAGLRGLRKRTLAKVYATTGTAAAIGGAERIVAGEPFSVGDFRIVPFSVEHDAADPVGYALEAGDRRLIVAMDLGVVPPCLGDDATDIILEANWDEDAMGLSVYEPRLRERIRRWHLSNTAVAEFVEQRMARTVERLTLCHLSKECNLPRIAHHMAATAAASAGRNGLTIEVH